MGITPFGPQTRPTLLLRLRNPQDEEAWGTFVTCYAPFIVQYCRRRGLQESTALDVTQEVMSQVFRSIGSMNYDPERSGFRGWLFTVTRSKISSHFRKASQQPGAVGGEVNGDEWNNLEDTEWTQELNAYVLQKAFDRIRPEFHADEWRAFESTWIEKQPGKQVADLLCRKVTWVHKTTFRIRARLEQEIRNLSEDCPFLC